MLFKLLDVILGYAKETPAWPILRPVAALVSLYLTALVLAYQFIEWQYRLSPPLTLFLRSYLAKQITVLCAALGVVGVLLRHVARAPDPAWAGARPLMAWQRGRRAIAVVVGVAAVAVALCAWLAPRTVADIRVKFLTVPDVDPYAVAYLLYELNRAQKQWFFEVDFVVFNPTELTSADRARCAGRERALCVAETLAGGRPFIGITAEPLGEDFFWQQRGPVAVVSTGDWRGYTPPSEYEFLAYAVIVQSVVLHLTVHCAGLPQDAFQESRVSTNDLFQFSPRRQAMKAAILAAHLNRRGEELLFNCFGAEYVAAAGNLLSLEWLRAGRVLDNLERTFGVRIQGDPRGRGVAPKDAR